MRLVVLQPGYLPWAGYFDQLRRCDVFVHYDDVQFDKHGWRNRNRIRSNVKDGWSWLTVPVQTGGKFGARIDQVQIDNRSRWAKKHWGTLEQHYKKTPHFSRYAEPLRAIYEQEWERLVDLDLALTTALIGALGIDPPGTIVRSSELSEVPPGQDATQRLIDLCRHFGATEYLSGAAARDYLQVPKFEEIGCQVTFQDYQHPTYPQRYPGEFVSHLAVVDLLFNVGPESLRLLCGAAPERD